MADGVFNVTKGSVAEKVTDASTSLGILLLKVAESDASLEDRTTVADILTGNTEADFTNYARITGITGTVTRDYTGNVTDVDLPDQTWTSAGGTADNDLVKLVIFLDEGGTDATRIPLTHHDFVVTTNGLNILAQLASSPDGFYQAA